MKGTEAKEYLQQMVENLSLQSDKNTVVLVEDRDDVAFWKLVLQEFAPNIKPNFPFFSSSGKSELKRFADVKSELRLSDKALICVDSDNDGYHQTKNTDWLSPRRPFIYQTYAHSRENLLINPKTLLQDCEELTTLSYDFQAFFDQISASLHNYLMLWLFLTDDEHKWRQEDIKEMGIEFSWPDLKSIIERCGEHSNLNNAETLEGAEMLITEFKVQFTEHFKQTRATFKENDLEYLWEEFEVFKEKCPIKPAESLWFIQGHRAFDSIIVPFFDKIVHVLSLQQADNSKSPEEKNRWQNIAKGSYRDRLSISYQKCLLASMDCRFFPEIKRDFQQDFPKP